MATAGVTHEVVLDGVGYMLSGAKEAYVCSGNGPRAAGLASGVATGVSGSTALGNVYQLVFDEWRSSGRWWAGVGETLNDGRAARLEGVRPVAGGAAAVLIPAARFYTQAGTPSEARYTAAVYKNIVYFSIGNKLYKLTNNASNLFTGYVDTGGVFSPTVTDLVVHEGLLYIATSANLWSYDGTTFTDVTATFGAATYVGSYGGLLFWRTGAATDVLNWRVPATSTNYSRGIGAGVIRRILGAAGALWIGSQGGLYRLEGVLKAGNPSTAPGALNLFEPKITEVLKTDYNFATTNIDQNFTNMMAAQGYLWFWANGRVYRLAFSEASGPGSAKVEPQPLFGKLRGMNVCDGLVVVALESQGFRYLWAWEAEHGWWLVESGSSTANNYSLPFSGLPQCKDGAIITPMYNALDIARWPLDNSYLAGRNPNVSGLTDVSNTGFVTLPAFGLADLARAAGMAGRSVVARLLAVGVEWGVPANLNDWADFTPYIVGGSSAGAITFEVWLSINAGASWVMLGNYAPPDYNTFGNGKRSWALSAGQGEAVTLTGNTPGWYQVRLKVAGPHAPALKRLWVEYRLDEVQHASGREWKLKLNLGDPATTLNLQGQPGSSSGGWAGVSAARSSLRTLWDNGTTVDFYDVDGSGPYRVKATDFRVTRLGAGVQGTVVGNDWEYGLSLVEVSEG